MEDILTKRFQKTALLCLFVIIVTGGLYRCGGQNAASDADAQTWAEQTLSTLSLEEKIGQLICADITADYITEDNPRFQNWVRLARDYCIGGFVLYGYFGSLHQDKKKLHQTENKLTDFISGTSIIPFAANLTRKQPLKLGEVSKVGIVAGVVFTIVARVLHPEILNQLF